MEMNFLQSQVSDMHSEGVAAPGNKSSSGHLSFPKIISTHHGDPPATYTDETRVLKKNYGMGPGLR
jgi:hypothetical protein